MARDTCIKILLTTGLSDDLRPFFSSIHDYKHFSTLIYPLCLPLLIYWYLSVCPSVRPYIHPEREWEYEVEKNMCSSHSIYGSQKSLSFYHVDSKLTSFFLSGSTFTHWENLSHLFFINNKALKIIAAVLDCLVLNSNLY